MTSPSPDVTAALATLQARWGSAAPRWGGEVVGALATTPLPLDSDPVPGPVPVVAPGLDRVVPTGFRALDAILGPGGLPRTASVAIRGDLSSGRTTLALRMIAEAQSTGAIVAWLDLARSLDPVEAVARGVRLEWLVALVPDSLEEGLAMAGSLARAELRICSSWTCRPAAGSEGPAWPTGSAASLRSPGGPVCSPSRSASASSSSGGRGSGSDGTSSGSGRR